MTKTYHSEKVIGLDLSLNKPGLVVLVNGKAVVQRVIATPKKVTGVSRLDWLRMNVAGALPLDADLLVMEGYAFGAKNQAHQIGEAGGVVKLEIADLGIPGLLVPPSVLKRYATGKGSGPKDEVKLGAFKRWGFQHASNDVVDAYIVARLGQEVLTKGTKAAAALLEKCQPLDDRFTAVQVLAEARRRNQRRVG